MDYSIRIPATPGRINRLEEMAKSIKPLPQLIDHLYKPVDKSLTEFSPDQICIRMRVFVNSSKPSTLEIIKTTKSETGYTDTKEILGQGNAEDLIRLAKNNNYEKWGEITTQSIEYQLDYANILFQNLSPIGQYLKIESPTEQGLTKAMKLLQARKTEGIRTNAAVLLLNYQKLNAS